MTACEFVGLPECQLTLAQAVTYLACAPKSNASTLAIGEAVQDVREGRLLPCRSTCETPTIPERSAWVMARATSMPTTTRTASRHKTTWRRAGVLSSCQPRFEAELARRLSDIRQKLHLSKTGTNPQRRPSVASARLDGRRVTAEAEGPVISGHGKPAASEPLCLSTKSTKGTKALFRPFWS